MSLELATADGRVTVRPSVALVICQVRFDDQEIAASAAIDFHERLGGEQGLYSKIEQAPAAGRIVFELGPSGPFPQAGRQNAWSFEPEDGSWSVTLLPDSVSLQVNEGSGAYNGWDDFRERLAKVLGALQEIASPALEQRVGLRFVDRIPGTPIGAEDASGWSEYINASFLGAVTEPAIAKAARFAQQQVVLNVGDNTVCSVREGLAAVLSVGEANTEYVIDTDVYREGGKSFDSATILEGVDAFRQTIDDLFGTITTPALLEKLAT